MMHAQANSTRLQALIDYGHQFATMSKEEYQALKTVDQKGNYLNPLP